jgi:hypothetical protein
MALTFTPSTIAMPSPPSYAAPQTPAVSGNALSMLGDLANIDLSQQQLKKAQATFNSDVSKAQSDAATAQIGVGKAETEAAKSKLGLNNEFRDSMLKVAGPYASDERALNAAKLAPNASPEEIKKAKDDVLEMNYEIKQQLRASGISNSDIAQHMNYLDDIGIKSPQLYTKALNKGIQTLAGASNIAEQNQPKYITNAASQTTSVVPAQGGNSMQIVQPAYMQDNLGQVVKTPYQNPNPSSVQVQTAKDVAGTMTADFAATQKEAGEAQPRIATFQNIKKLVPDAYTGVGSERKKFLTGVANALDIDINTLENSTTDELAKNAAILQLAGGNTDAARQIASIATPSGKMTKDAILNISDQMIGMEKLKQAKAQFLAPVANDPVAYQNKLNQFNLVNDYRIFQESSPEQVAKLKASMTKEEQNKISAKIKLARQMDLIK